MTDSESYKQFPPIRDIIVVLILTFMLVFFFSLLGSILGLRTGLFLVEGVIIIPAFLYVLYFKYPLAKIFRLRSISLSVFGLSVILGIGLSIIVDEFDRLFQMILPMPEIIKELMEKTLTIDSTSDLFIIIFSAVILAAVLEELLFRGFVQTAFEQAFDVTRAIMATAIVFAVAHFNPWWTVQFTFFGIFLGVMAWKSGSVIPAIVVHFINNGIALIFSNIPPEKLNWYASENHVRLPILFAAIAVTYYGMKLFYQFSEKMKEKESEMLTQGNVPVIRIGVLQSVDRVEFSCNKNFSVLNEQGEKIFSGEEGRTYVATIAESQPAQIRFQVRAAIEKEKSKAEKRAREFQESGIDASVRCVGLEIQTENFRLDNREYWVVLGDFPDRQSAQQFRQSQENPGEYVVVENITQKASATIELAGQKFTAPIRIVPDEQDRETHITVSDIVIGIEFHWQKLEQLDYRGIVEIGVNNSGNLVVVNEVNIEDYLTSVNSSEMTPDCPLGLLEAQTVAARSTVFATMGKHHYNANFHLCSDDHCQCYHGKKREQAVSRQAVENTWGEVMMYENEVCDARYSKICGGIIEAYHNVWENRKIPYMMSGIDSDKPLEFPANTEEKAKKLIDSEPDCYCNTNYYKLPPRLANLYSTENLFRWTVEYRREDLEKLIEKKTGQDIGELLDIVPLERGDSGRLIYINLVGSKKTLKVGKELEIRRVLSESHLYSSMFYVEKETGPDGKVEKFILKGGGWGHGVGLCQVGATVMAMKNIPYQDILKHYYQGIRLEKLY